MGLIGKLVVPAYSVVVSVRGDAPSSCSVEGGDELTLEVSDVCDLALCSEWCGDLSIFHNVYHYGDWRGMKHGYFSEKFSVLSKVYMSS